MNCWVCKRSLPVEAFGRCRARASGRQSRCRECDNRMRRERMATREAQDRDAMRKRGGDGSAPYTGSIDRLDAYPHRCISRLFTTRPCRDRAVVWTSGGRWCAKHLPPGSRILRRLDDADATG